MSRQKPSKAVLRSRFADRGAIRAVLALPIEPDTLGFQAVEGLASTVYLSPKVVHKLPCMSC
jgi:hypothetical protein